MGFYTRGRTKHRINSSEDGHPARPDEGLALKKILHSTGGVWMGECADGMDGDG